MKILFDHQIFSSQVHGGVSRYFAELLNVMPRDIWEVSAWLSNNEYSSNYRLFTQTPFFPEISFRGKGRIMSEIGKSYSLRRIRKGDFDIFHQTNFDDYSFKALGSVPLVTTYHDVNFLTGRNYNKRMVSLQRKALDRADKIIAVSSNTKKDMLDYFDVNPEKIEVIHHGISSNFIADSDSERIISRPYILYVGMRHAFKNFIRFIKAFALLANKYPDIDVVCTRNPFTKEEIATFKELGITGRVQHVSADEKLLSVLYRDALFFVFPSEYEGFGMPILEAMINKCPVLLSNSSCFPEIAQDNAIYFDPLDIQSIVFHMEKLIDDDSLRMTLSLKGFEHARSFSWEKTAEKHIKVYSSLL